MWQIQPYIFPVVPGRAGGGSFREKKTINQRKIAYRMCARRPASAMPKPSFLCAPAFRRWRLLFFLFILDIFLGLYYSFILVFFDSTILWLYWLYYSFTLRCRSYIGSFSTKLPLIIFWCYVHLRNEDWCTWPMAWSQRRMLFQLGRLF